MHQGVTMVYKFGGSSVRDAERMREVAKIVCAFPEHKPALVLSAMGKTTNLLLEAGEIAQLTLDPADVPTISALQEIQELHHATMEELCCDDAAVKEVNELLKQLEQLLTGIALMQEVTPRTKDNLVSFGERMSTRIFASYLRAQGIKAQQYDSFEYGLVTTDDFTNGDVLPETYPALAKALGGAKDHIPVVTGFLGRGVESGAITTLGRGGSDLSATVIAKALDLPEAQVWKDVDGVLSADPRFVKGTQPVPTLTYNEAMELSYFGAQVLHPQAMRPAIEADSLTVRVKNSYNTSAPGTVIRRERDLGDDTLLTSIVLKRNVTLLDIVSTRMLGQYGFLAKVFEVMQDNEISVDVVATSEVSVSLTLDSAKLFSRDLSSGELDKLKADFGKIANVEVTTGQAVISLICNGQDRSSELMQRVFKAFEKHDIVVKMISQGASKTNIAMVVDMKDGETAVRAIHAEFFGTGMEGP